MEEEILVEALAIEAEASIANEDDLEELEGEHLKDTSGQGNEGFPAKIAMTEDLAFLVSDEDVFLPSPQKMMGLEDYYALKETLSWTNATDYWPDIGETDWVVLHDSAILTSSSTTVSIVKGDTTNLTITGGKNLIFLDSSEMTINQTGGISEIYFDPSLPSKINLNIAGGITAVSQISLISPDISEVQNQDGSRTIQNGSVEIKYQTGDTGDIFLNDMISGQITKAIPTFTLRDDVPLTPNENEASDILLEPEFSELAPDIPKVFPIRPINDKADTLDRSDIDVDDPLTYFEDDVVVDFKATDVVSDYLSLPQRESWQYAAATYRASDDLTINVSSDRQGAIQKIEQVYESLKEENLDTVDQLLVIQEWDDLLSDDLMDLFYVE